MEATAGSIQPRNPHCAWRYVPAMHMMITMMMMMMMMMIMKMMMMTMTMLLILTMKMVIMSLPTVNIIMVMFFSSITVMLGSHTYCFVQTLVKTFFQMLFVTSQCVSHSMSIIKYRIWQILI